MTNKTKTPTRSQAMASALASVRVEGLQPSLATIERMKRYVEGKITVTELQRETLREVRRRANDK